MQGNIELRESESSFFECSCPSIACNVMQNEVSQGFKYSKNACPKFLFIGYESPLNHSRRL